MLKKSHYVFWILIFHSCDESTILAVTSPVQTFVGWNASFNMQLDPYPKNDSLITVVKNGTLIMRVKGTQSRDVADRFEFTGNTIENQISFVLRNVTLVDAGTYNATESGLSPGGKQILIVKVDPSKPQIVPITGSAVLGSDYRLNCSSVSNSAPPDHGLTMMSEWKVNDQLITTGIGYQVQGTELTITSLTRQYNGAKLSCVAYEDSLAKSVPSNEHVIDVKYGPDNVQLNPSGGIIKAIENHSVIIQCTADCNPTCSFHWRRVSVPGYLKPNQTLMIDSLGKIDTDNYTCTVSNGITGRSQSLQTTLVVLYGAEIVSLSVLDSNTVNENSSAIFQCHVDSNPLPTITWRKEDTDTVFKTESGVVQSQFRIESAQCQDLGNYTCSAYNGIRTQANGTLQFFVKCHPRTDSEVPLETKVYKKRHEAAFLSYTVISYPLPKFTWMFLGNGSESRNLPDSASLYVNGRQSELQFTSLNIDDFGYYSVMADNSLPPPSREVFEIISADVPEVPSNITITEVTESSITIQWMAGYNGGPKQTFIVFASTGNFTMNITASDPGYGNIGTVVMKGLAACTKYSIYMSASNSVGSSNLTEAIFIITLEESRTDTLGNPPIPAVAGGIGAGAMVILLVLLSIFLWRRYLYSRKHSDENLSEKFEKRGRQGSGLVPNQVYDSSESPTSFSINQVAIGAEYSAVVKPKKKVNEKEDQSNLYAQVDKTLT
ncbi:hypothetical protein CHS0354_036915, partial [Potamilus streckersoni]